ncbi:hypothetical protein [Streptomyces sp. NPDC015242]|uniref:hypothetical protein n=1 Tax=Streptomyces sp. NPDC015242 TaxID=3364951 RepID=UPI0036FED726
MPDYAHGTGAHAPDDLASLVGTRLGLVFAARDSSFLGAYHLATFPGGQMRIQPNRIPGEDGEDDLYTEELPADWVLLLTTTDAEDAALAARLDALDGLVRVDGPT